MIELATTAGGGRYDPMGGDLRDRDRLRHPSIIIIYACSHHPHTGGRQA